MAANVAAGLGTYADWAPAGWAAPRVDPARIAIHLHRAFGFVAPDGHVAVLPETVGAAVPLPGTAHLWQLFVAGRAWGSGLASTLMRAALDEVRTRGFTRVTLWTPRDHSRARRFYAREGFAETGVGRFDDELDLGLVQYAAPARRSSAYAARP